MFALSRNVIRTATAAASCTVLLSACGTDVSSSTVSADAPATIEVTSTAFGEGDPIPELYTCDGDEVAPPLAWSGVPADAAAVALVVDDPDAPSGTFTHWVVVDIPTSTTSSPEGGVPDGGVQVTSSAGSAAYAGPCPPSGTHHYRFTVLALDAETGLAEGASLDEALAAVDDHAVARGTLTGTYSRD
jgi:Raf kinase inhibitor-like YbhB/YbcL family protein